MDRFKSGDFVGTPSDPALVLAVTQHGEGVNASETAWVFCLIQEQVFKYDPRELAAPPLDLEALNPYNSPVSMWTEALYALGGLSADCVRDATWQSGWKSTPADHAVQEVKAITLVYTQTLAGLECAVLQQTGQRDKA